MVLRKSLVYFILIIITISNAFAQNPYLNNDSLKLNTNKAKISYGIDMGSTYINIGSGLSYNYVAPYVLYPLSNKFSLELGMRLSTGNMFQTFNPYSGEQFNLVPANMFQKTFYARGHYIINPDLSIFGTGYYQNNVLFSGGIDNNINFDTKAMSLGFEYKISNSASLQFEIQTGNLYNQNYYLFAPSHSMFNPSFVRQ